MTARKAPYLLCLVAVFVLVGGLSAQTAWVFNLDGGQEVPAVTTSASGVGFATLDGANNFTLSVQHNVVGVTAAHIHLAPAGASGPIFIGLGTGTSPITFSTTLSASDVASLMAGDFYVNIHSATNPAGEIRGQIVNAFQQQVFINEYCNDPYGSTGLDTNLDGVFATSASQQEDEFVEIVNGTDQTVDIGGWTLADAVLVRHTFSSGTMLPPGAAIVVFGGGSVATFNSMGFSGVLADTGSLGLNNSSDTITIADSMGNTIDTYSYTSGGPDDGNGESVVRTPETPLGTFGLHTLTPGGLSFSTGLHADGIFPWGQAILPSAAYPGNGTDAATSVSINGANDNQVSNIHGVQGGDVIGLQFSSPGGSLSTAPFLALAQLFTTGAPPAALLLPGDAMPSVYLDLASPVIVLADGLSTPGGILSPILSGYTVTGQLPVSLTGTNTSIMIVLLASDPGLNAVNLGAADAHELRIL